MRKHANGDRRWRIGFSWALALVLALMIGEQIRIHFITQDLEQANCTIVRLVEANVRREMEAALTGRKLLRTSLSEQRPARVRSIARHERNAREGRLFANSLRENVDCPK